MSEPLLRLRPHVQWRDVDGEIVALDVERSLYLSTSRTGALLWRELSEGTTCERLVSRLTEEFEVDTETAARDVDAFVAQLDRSGYIEWVGE